jgi:ethanolamine ammonia-lyase small subunit
MSAPESKSEADPTTALDGTQTNDTALLSPAMAARLRSLTPARVALRRSGISIATGELLDFQLAHARARDAVHAALQAASLTAALRQSLTGLKFDVIPLHSAAKDRQAYLQSPDLGRILDETSRQRLQDVASQPFDLSIVLADGLSALAVERHATPLLAELLPALLQSSPELRLAPICIVEQGRVAVADEVAHALPAALAIVLIGERPGLSSPDSLGAYITWQPQPGITTDAERNCISNIRAEGLSYPQAAARLLHYIREARARRLTGVALKDPDPALESRSELQSASQKDIVR